MTKKYISKKMLLTIAAGALFICLLGITGLYLGRNSLLRSMADKRMARLEQAYGLRMHYERLEMNGWNEISLDGFSVVPHGRDTLLTLRHARVKLHLGKLLMGKIAIHHVTADSLSLDFIKRNSTANYDFLFRKNVANQTPEEIRVANYAQRTDRLINLCFSFIPENGQLDRIRITERKDSSFVSFSLPSLTIGDNRFETTLDIREDTLVQHWATRGELNRRDELLKVGLYALGTHKISLPYITRRFGAKATFDTLSCSLARQRTSTQEVRLSGQAKVSGLDVFHKALSPEIIHLNRGELSYRLNIGKQTLEVDSATNVLFNKIQFHPYLRAKKDKEHWHVTASLRKPWFPADELFGSLPKGLFGNLEGIRTSGKLDYRFLLDVDFALPDSLQLVSELKEKDFRIIQYGATPLSKMSEEFVYTAYEQGMPVRSFPVGPSWEQFTPLDSIAPILQMSVLQSEDGAFFYHHGFLPDAMREALIYDLQVKRFARGGSTITMQLVKNVFLNRNKNFARKLEEALIVWLIETERLTTKERMYEVYLNIAEWGPQIYGIREASAYYFDKRPSQLNTEESIFLASIIPKPKRFRWSFDENGQLKESMQGYYRLIAERLAKKGLISESEAERIRPEIRLKGRVLQDIIKE